MRFTEYVRHLQALEYFQYDLRVHTFDLNFKYKNVKFDLEYKLDVYGVVDFVNTKEYLIYSETRNTGADSWYVRIPEISNKYFHIWNDYNGNYPSRWTRNVSQLPDKQAVYVGLDYENIEENNTGYPASASNYLGVYTDAVVSSNILGQTAGGTPGNNITLRNLKYVNVNMNDAIGSYVSQYYSIYGTHPGLNINYDETQNEGRPRKYFFLPIGVSSYNIVLTSLTNGEKNIFRIQGSLQENPAFSNPPRITVSSQGLPVGAPAETLILDAVSNTQSGGNTTVSASLFMPNLVGQSLVDANAVLNNLGLNNRRTVSQEEPGYITATVLEQTPAAGFGIVNPNTQLVTLIYSRPLDSDSEGNGDGSGGLGINPQ